MTGFDTRHLHPYRGSDELPKILHFVGECNALVDFCGCLHLAAFLIYWIDPVSKSGLFEPVGSHQDFQRQGLTRALMYEGMRRMVAHGMTKAIVKHQPAQQNPAAAALYRSVGFTLKYTITDYRKQIQ
jgi:predicted acetyltransferase